jgi:GTP-binding protein
MSEKGGDVRIAQAEFVAGAARAADIPPPGAPEIAFAGRSNVGKSSLLNMLLERRSLARTSSTPGCTRQINFFDVAPVGMQPLVFVDLPGYGYAKLSKAETQGWKKLLEGYLLERPTLRAVVILVDARRGLEDEEEELVAFLASARRPSPIRVLVCATKVDKLPRSQAKAHIAALQRGAGMKVLATSATTRAGRAEVWREIMAALA